MSEVSIKIYGDALSKLLDIRATLERENEKPYSITAVLETLIYDYFEQ